MAEWVWFVRPEWMEVSLPAWLVLASSLVSGVFVGAYVYRAGFRDGLRAARPVIAPFPGKGGDLD